MIFPSFSWMPPENGSSTSARTARLPQCRAVELMRTRTVLATMQTLMKTIRKRKTLTGKDRRGATFVDAGEVLVSRELVPCGDEEVQSWDRIPTARLPADSLRP